LVSESGELLRLRIASVRTEHNGLVRDPGRTAGDNPLQNSVVGKGIPPGSWPRLIKDFMGRTGVNVHCCLLYGRLWNGELLPSHTFSSRHDTQFDRAAVLSAFIKQETRPTGYPPARVWKPRIRACQILGTLTVLFRALAGRVSADVWCSARAL
jgi:hypothetical protein